jgi:hypothetical protein
MRSLAPAIAILALLAVAVSTGCDDDDPTGVRNNNFAAEEPFSFDIQLTTQTGLDLQGINGTIEITGVPGSTSVSVTGEKRVESDSVEDAEAQLALIEINVNSPAEAVEVATEQPAHANGRNYIVNYTIEVPQVFGIHVTNINGGITVAAIDSNVVIQGVNGAVVASVTLPPAGLVDIRMANGSIGLVIPQDTSADFQASLANGSIVVTDLTLANIVQTPTSLSGTLGQGNGTITLRIVNGVINVTGVE